MNGIGMRLFIPLFGGITVVIVVLLGYLWGYESTLMVAKERQILQIQSRALAQTLIGHVEQLDKEVLFLSRLEVMDDMITSDMDRRITALLIQKSADLGAHLIAITPQGEVVASSDLGRITTHRERPRVSGRLDTHGIEWVHPMYSSLDHRLLGWLILEYPRAHLEPYVRSTTSVCWLDRDPHSASEAYIDATTRWDRGALSGWVLHYALPRAEVLAPLYHFQMIVLWALGGALVISAGVLWMMIHRISAPLRELSEMAQHVARSGDYTQTLIPQGVDEVAHVAQSFNTLMAATQHSLERLAIERQVHADRLVSILIFFATITRDQTQEQTLQSAMEEIMHLSGAHHVELQPTRQEGLGLQTSQGWIHIIDPQIHHDERFYAALEKMVQLQLERIALLEATQSALKAKSTFLSAMSHELRTPIGSIVSLTQYLMVHPHMSEELSLTLEKIEYSAHHLLHVINHILDLAKAEAGKIEPQKETVSLQALIQESLDLVLPLIEEKSLELVVHIEENLPVMISDPRLLTRIVMNLLSNAIKYTHSGTITLTLVYDDGRYHLRILDTGCGIDPEAQPYLFDEFYGGHPSLGSGFGLALSKRLAILLRGDVWVTSEGIGCGSEAHFVCRSLV